MTLEISLGGRRMEVDLPEEFTGQVQINIAADRVNSNVKVLDQVSVFRGGVSFASRRGDDDGAGPQDRRA